MNLLENHIVEIYNEKEIKHKELGTLIEVSMKTTCYGRENVEKNWFKPEEWEEEEERRDYIVETFMDLASSLLGNSEDYLCRVMQICRVTYSPSDIYVDIVEF